jgi:hypothetical protein
VSTLRFNTWQNTGGTEAATASEVSAYSFTEPALVLISRTTIGTAVSSVTVSNCFSSTYDNYKVIVAIDSTTNNSQCVGQLGAGSVTTTNYNSYLYTEQNAWGTFSPGSVSSTSGLILGYCDTVLVSHNSNDIISPYRATRTSSFGFYVQDDNGGFQISRQTDATQFTDITVGPAAGTMTGGYIDVYGYVKS